MPDREQNPRNAAQPATRPPRRSRPCFLPRRRWRLRPPWEPAPGIPPPAPGSGSRVPPHESTLYRSLRSEEHTSELQSLMRISYAVFCLKKNNTENPTLHTTNLDYTN